MVGFIAGPREDETFYSMLARIGSYLGVTGVAGFMEAVQGSCGVIASPDLPGHINAFARLPGHALSADAVIDGLTLYRFYTAFAPQDVRDLVRTAMGGDMTGVFTRLGLAAYRIPVPRRLRYCPECLDRMLERGPDPWWMRSHQLPGILACRHHGTALRDSRVDVTRLNRHRFVACSAALCDGEAPAAMSPEILRGMKALARKAGALLDAERPARSYADIAADYRVALGTVGLMRSERKVDHRRLWEAVGDKWGPLLGQPIGVALPREPGTGWLASLVRGGRRGAHPILHLLLEGAIDCLEPVERPFGKGPWPCRNPVSGHHLEAVVEIVTVRRDREMVYGDFRCGCGYIYTCSRDLDGRIGPPRFKSFGPTFVPALRASLRSGAGIRAASARLGLNPKTLVRHAAMTGIAVPWSTKPSGRIDLPPPVRPRRPSRGRRRPVRRRRSRVDWATLDRRIEGRIVSEAASAHAQEPPVRLSFAELERRVSTTGWLFKRRSRLPRASRAMARVEEAIEQFQRRRLAWHAGRLAKAGEWRPSVVLRSAGLRSVWLEEARTALAIAHGAAR